MYAYYMLSAIPSMQKYLWWKRYLTIMQIVSSGPHADGDLLTLINFSHRPFRFSSWLFSVIQLKFSSNQTATSRSQLLLFCHSTLPSSPTCSHRSTSNLIIKKLKLLLMKRKSFTTRTAMSFIMVKRS